MSTLRVPCRRLPQSKDLPLPKRQSEGAAGLDLYAALTEALVLAPGSRALVPTGLEIAIPPGYEGQVRARSGLAVKHGLGLVNAPGTIDSDYRGEIRVPMINWGGESVTLKRGDRIAQLVIAPVAQAELEESDVLPETNRGGGGFGSTGS